MNTNPERWSDEFSLPVAESGRKAVIFLFAGMAVGTALALLFAPKRGSELRGDIARGCRQTIEELTSRVRQLRERTQNLRGELQERVPNLLRFRRRAGGVGTNSGV